MEKKKALYKCQECGEWHEHEKIMNFMGITSFGDYDCKKKK